MDATGERVGAQARARVRDAQRAQRLPSVSAGLACRGEVLLREAVGLAHVAPDVEATPDTQYRIGSITKTFTAAAALALCDDGALDLDADVRELLPSLRGRGITLRRLLSHSSGMQREPQGDIWDTLEMPDRAQLLASFPETEQVLRPGEEWHYSNLAYAVVAELVQQAAGEPCTDVIDRRLLAPLGLSRTTWQPAEPVAQGYAVDPYDDTVHEEAHVDLGAGSAIGQLYSTQDDLLRWGAFLAGDGAGILATPTLEAMHAPHAITDPWRWARGWGLGIALHRRGDHVLGGHDGAMPGHLSALVWSRPRGIVAVALTNTAARARPTELALELAAGALDALPSDEPPWRPSAAVPPEVAGLLGRWWAEGWEFELAWRGDELQAVLLADPARPPARFAPEGDDRWRTIAGRERGELLRVTRDDKGRVERLHWATYPMTRAHEPFSPPPAR